MERIESFADRCDRNREWQTGLSELDTQDGYKLKKMDREQSEDTKKLTT